MNADRTNCDRSCGIRSVACLRGRSRASRIQVSRVLRTELQAALSPTRLLPQTLPELLLVKLASQPSSGPPASLPVNRWWVPAACALAAPCLLGVGKAPRQPPAKGLIPHPGPACLPFSPSLPRPGSLGRLGLPTEHECCGKQRVLSHPSATHCWPRGQGSGPPYRQTAIPVSPIFAQTPGTCPSHCGAAWAWLWLWPASLPALTLSQSQKGRPWPAGELCTPLRSRIPPHTHTHQLTDKVRLVTPRLQVRLREVPWQV